jgi:hypothetical protein
MDAQTKTFIERPTPPIDKLGKRLSGPHPSLSGVWFVTRGAQIVAVYNPFYFWHASEIVADFVGVIRSQEDWEDWDADYALWKTTGTADHYWLMAAIRWRPDAGGQSVEFYEVKSDHHRSDCNWPGWPTREQWIERGRGDLWLTDDPASK